MEALDQFFIKDVTTKGAYKVDSNQPSKLKNLALTEDNLELTFQVNYLSHFYLCHLLKSAMLKALMPKIVSISSESHRFSLLANSEEFLAESCLNKTSTKNFYPTLSYNDSKLFCLMFALEANEKWKNIRAIAVHPGNMISSNLSRHWWLYQVLFGFVRPFAKSLSQVSFRLNHLHVTGFRKNFKTLQT